MPSRRCSTVCGFQAGSSLFETLVAMLLLATTLAGAVPLLAACMKATSSARVETGALISAAARLEELSSLRYDQDAGSLSLETDLDTSLADVPISTSGTGLAPGAANAAWENLPGAVDWMDATWQAVGSDSARGVITRRWAVAGLPAPTGVDRLLFHVFARSTAEEGRDPPRRDARALPGDVWLFGVGSRGLR